MPMELNNKLTMHFDAIGVNYQLEIYPNAEHSFCFPKRYCYAPEADDRDWRIITDLFERRLG